MKALAPIGPRRVSVLALLGLVGGIAAATWTGGGLAGAAPKPVGILGRLELSPEQQDRIEQLRERERAPGCETCAAPWYGASASFVPPRWSSRSTPSGSIAWSPVRRS
jgi:hypothetical protein